MQQSDVTTKLKREIGMSLGEAAGDVCMRTRCQDIVPKALSGVCKEAGRGKAARKACREYLEECQRDKQGKKDCVTRCGRYFEGEMIGVCVRDCDLKRCRVYEPYDRCVAYRTVKDVLECFEGTEWRRKAEECLRERCGVKIKEGERLGSRGR